MPRYFMKATTLAGAERQMMMQPNFHPRGGGRRSHIPFRYRPEDVDCIFCAEYHRRMCAADVCPYIQERLEAEAVGYSELVRLCFHDSLYQSLMTRIMDLTAQRSFGFLDRAHDSRFQGCLHGAVRQAGQLTLAALYLLTADGMLWEITAPALHAGGINGTVIRMRDGDLRQYVLCQAARGFRRGVVVLSPDLLSDPERVDDETLWLIVNGSLIARYGEPVMKLKEGVVYELPDRGRTE